jgi:hypothetical protein
MHVRQRLNWAEGNQKQIRDTLVYSSPETGISITDFDHKLCAFYQKIFYCASYGSPDQSHFDFSDTTLICTRLIRSR